MPLAGMHLNAIQALTSSVNVVGLRYPTEIFHLMEMAQHLMAPHVAMDSRWLNPIKFPVYVLCSH